MRNELTFGFLFKFWCKGVFVLFLKIYLLESERAGRGVRGEGEKERLPSRLPAEHGARSHGLEIMT